MKTTAQPNTEQLIRLQAFKSQHGRNWKSELLNQWLCGKDASQTDGHLLRQVRNQLGPSWLSKASI